MISNRCGRNLLFTRYRVYVIYRSTSVVLCVAAKDRYLKLKPLINYLTTYPTELRVVLILQIYQYTYENSIRFNKTLYVPCRAAIRSWAILRCTDCYHCQCEICAVSANQHGGRME